MDEVSFYELLGVSDQATFEEIKRSYIRKRREYGEDEVMQDKLNQAYDVLMDPQKRKDYDSESKYGRKLSELWQKYHSTEDTTELKEIMAQMQSLYLRMLDDDKENLNALKNLYEMERVLGNEKELRYLDSMLEVALNNEKLADREQWLEYIGDHYKLYEKVDEAVKAYYEISKINPSNDDAISHLVDLLYLEKKGIKTSIQVLNDCMNRVDDPMLKARYLSKAYEVAGSQKDNKYEKIKNVLLAKLQELQKEEEPLKTQIGMKIEITMAECLDNEQLESFDVLDKLYRSFRLVNSDANLFHRSLMEMRNILADCEYPECLNLLNEDIWTQHMRKKMENLLVKDIAKIKKFIEHYKNNAPTTWNLTLEKNQKVEELINRLYPLLIEYQKLENDVHLSKELKSMIRLLSLEGITNHDKGIEEFNRCSALFFAEERIEKSRDEIRLLERFYPTCYQSFSDIFFEGRSTGEILGEEPERTQNNVRSDNTYNNNSYNNASHHTAQANVNYRDTGKRSGPGLGIFIILIVLIVGLVFVISTGLRIAGSTKLILDEKKQEKYDESHNLYLSDDDLKKRDKLDDRYSTRKVDIHMTQVGGSAEPDYPESDYIWFVIWDGGYQTTYGVSSNYLTESEQNDFWEEVLDIYSGEDTDIEKCEQFYKLASEYVKKHEDNYVIVPNFIGTDFEKAKKQAEKLGISLAIANYVYSDLHPENAITYQYSGDEVEKGTEIFVDVSLGKDERVEVPYLIGESVEAVTKMGVTVNVMGREYSDEYAEGCIIYQDTEVGTKLDEGDFVGVVVSLGSKEPIMVFPSEYYQLQRISLGQKLTVEAIMDYFHVDEQFCEVIDDGEINLYQKTVIRFPSYFYGERGMTSCELYTPTYSNENPLIYFEWQADREFAFDAIYEVLLNSGYTDGYSSRGILVECEDGAIDIAAYSNGACYLRFSAY